MGRFEDRLAAGMRDSEFVEGYEEAQSEIYASQANVHWELAAGQITTLGVAGGRVTIDAPTVGFPEAMGPKVMVGGAA